MFVPSSIEIQKIQKKNTQMEEKEVVLSLGIMISNLMVLVKRRWVVGLQEMGWSLGVFEKVDLDWATNSHKLRRGSGR